MLLFVFLAGSEGVEDARVRLDSFIMTIVTAIIGGECAGWRTTSFLCRHEIVRVTRAMLLNHYVFVEVIS